MPHTVAHEFEDTSEGGHDVWRVSDGSRDPVCDCFDEADAVMIADALNAYREDVLSDRQRSPGDENNLEKLLDAIGQTVADRSGRAQGGVEHTLILLAAKAGAREYASIDASNVGNAQL